MLHGLALCEALLVLHRRINVISNDDCIKAYIQDILLWILANLKIVGTHVILLDEKFISLNDLSKVHCETTERSHLE